MNIFQTLTGEYPNIEEMYVKKELKLSAHARKKWVRLSKNILFHTEDKREMRYCSLCQKIEEKLDENIKVFQTLKGDCPIVKELYQTAEKKLALYEINSLIQSAKDIVYRIEDKEPMRYCYICESIKEESNFASPYGENWAYGVRPFCRKCLPLKRDYEKKVEKEKKLKMFALREERVVKESIQKEIREKEARERGKLYKAEKELHRYYYFEEHGVYPTSSKSDNNVIYVWQDTNSDNTYKIGISSKRVGTKRIYEVASGANMRADILHYEEVEDALTLEKELLKYGEAINFDRKFDGCTEFRHLTCDDLTNIETLINIYKIEY